MTAVGPGTPYVTPGILLNAPTGIAWNTIPGFNSQPAQQAVEALNLCNRASAALDAYCQTSLRATINTETVYGPGDIRAAIQQDGTMRLMMSRPPVVSVLSGSVQPRSAFPLGGSNATSIPANMMAPERPVMGIYGTNAPGAVGENGQAVLVAPGYGSWTAGRSGLRFTVTYLNGYPHSSLTQNYASGVSAIHVDDVTGMVGVNTGSGAPGAFCTFYSADDALQESNTVTSVTPDTAGAVSGPGMLHLVNPTANAHNAGDIFTTLPATIMQACILMASSYALVRGGTATSVQTYPGTVSRGGPDADASASLQLQAKGLVAPYMRQW